VHDRTGSLRRIHDVGCRRIKHAVIISLHANPDPFLARPSHSISLHTKNFRKAGPPLERTFHAEKTDNRNAAGAACQRPSATFKTIRANPVGRWPNTLPPKPSRHVWTPVVAPMRTAVTPCAGRSPAAPAELTPASIVRKTVSRYTTHNVAKPSNEDLTSRLPGRQLGKLYPCRIFSPSSLASSKSGRLSRSARCSVTNDGPCGTTGDVPGRAAPPRPKGGAW